MVDRLACYLLTFKVSLRSLIKYQKINLNDFYYIFFVKITNKYKNRLKIFLKNEKVNFNKCLVKTSSELSFIVKFDDELELLFNSKVPE